MRILAICARSMAAASEPVNGKRRHRAAVITWLGNGIADGSQGPDLSVIPSIAIRQAEVLRDGAAAQYGSDAIAGVMNFQLKDAREGGSLEFRTGAFMDANAGDTGTCGSGIIGDIKHSCNGIGGHGRAMSVAGNVGLPLGSTGFVNLSMEYGNANPTNRSIQRNDAQGIIDAGNGNIRNPAQVWGSPLLEDDLKLFGNFGHLFENGLQFYGHTNYAQRKVTGGFYFRNPHTRGGVFRGDRLDDGTPTLRVGNVGMASHYEMNGTHDGYTGPGCPTIPIVDNVPDAGALAAVEADPNCWTLYSRFTWDASVNVGTAMSISSSSTPSTRRSATTRRPRSIRADCLQLPAGQRQPQLRRLLSHQRRRDVAGRRRVARREVHDRRRRAAVLGDRSVRRSGLQLRVERLQRLPRRHDGGRVEPQQRRGLRRPGVQRHGPPVDARHGGRVENFEDFGTTYNGKISARAGLTDAFSLRAAVSTVSTGFRAPTPGQQNAFNVTTAFIGGEMTNKQGLLRDPLRNFRLARLPNRCSCRHSAPLLRVATIGNPAARRDTSWSTTGRRCAWSGASVERTSNLGERE